MRQTRGTTLIELMFGMVILSILFIMSMHILSSMTLSYGVEMADAEQQRSVTGAIYDLMSDVGSYTVLSPIGPASNSHLSASGDRITFRLPTGTDSAGKITWGEQITYCRELNPREVQFNGVDDDANGLVDDDDGILVRRVEDAATGNVISKTVLATNIPTGGFHIDQLGFSALPTPHFGPDLQGQSLRIRITRVYSNRAIADATKMTAATQRTFYLRNAQQ